MEAYPSEVLGNFCHPSAYISDCVLASWKGKGSYFLA